MSALTTSRRRLWSVGIGAALTLAGGVLVAPAAMAAETGAITTACATSLGPGAVSYHTTVTSDDPNDPLDYTVTYSYDNGYLKKDVNQQGNTGFGGFLFGSYGDTSSADFAAADSADHVTVTITDASDSTLATKTVSRADCGARPAPQPVSVTPQAPVFTDQPGTDHDTYTIPATEGVDYTVNGKVVSAGTYPATGKVTVKAVEQDGYTIEGDSSWSHKFTNEQPAPTKVTPTAPTFDDEAGTVHDTYTIPNVEGVDYVVGGKVVAPGTYPATGKVTVKAVEQDGYKIEGRSSWTFEFTDKQPPVTPPTKVTPPAPVFTDQPGTAHDTVTVPAADCVTYLLNGKVVAPGTYPATGKVTVKAVAKCGECVLVGQTSWPHDFSDEGSVPPVEQPVDNGPSGTVTPPAVQPQVGPSTSVSNADLNEGFGARTAWDEHVTSSHGDAWEAGLGLSLMVLGLAIGIFGCRRRTRGASA